MVRGYSDSEGSAGALLVGLGALVPLGSSAKQHRFWCDFCEYGVGVPREGTAFDSRFNRLACSSTKGMDVPWTSGVSLRSDH